jgi:methionyl-tRNA synthetase
MDLRVVKVLAAEAVPKTKKLLKLTIDTGVDQRTVVSGIAEHYTPEDVVGKHVLFLANLAPRAIKGVESAGMILMAENPQGQLSILTTERDPSIGSVVK